MWGDWDSGKDFGVGGGGGWGEGDNREVLIRWCN